MSAQKKTGLVVMGLIVLGMLALGWYEYRDLRAAKGCGFCGRPLQSRLRVIADIDGRRHDVCCPQCAVSESRQEHKPVKLILVHDYTTGHELDPKQAWFVNGSRAIACRHDGMRMDEMKHTEDLAFDRCSPGAFAFAKKEDAEVFVQQNGGTVQTMAQLLGEAATR